MTVYLTLKCKNTGKLSNRDINPLQEQFRRKPIETIEEWIRDHGNAQHSTQTQPASLELVSYFVR